MIYLENTDGERIPLYDRFKSNNIKEKVWCSVDTLGNSNTIPREIRHLVDNVRIAINRHSSSASKVLFDEKSVVDTKEVVFGKRVEGKAYSVRFRITLDLAKKPSETERYNIKESFEKQFVIRGEQSSMPFKRNQSDDEFLLNNGKEYVFVKEIEIV